LLLDRIEPFSLILLSIPRRPETLNNGEGPWAWMSNGEAKLTRFRTPKLFR
jgi:hypothetical protein